MTNFLGHGAAPRSQPRTNRIRLILSCRKWNKKQRIIEGSAPKDRPRGKRLPGGDGSRRGRRGDSGREQAVGVEGLSGQTRIPLQEIEQESDPRHYSTIPPSRLPQTEIVPLAAATPLWELGEGSVKEETRFIRPKILSKSFCEFDHEMDRSRSTRRSSHSSVGQAHAIRRLWHDLDNDNCRHAWRGSSCFFVAPILAMCLRLSVPQSPEHQAKAYVHLRFVTLEQTNGWSRAT